MSDYIFKSDLIKGACLADPYDMPVIQPCTDIPCRLVSITDTRKTADYEQWIHFYKNDDKIIGFIKNPEKYLDLVNRFEGIIMPDLSVYTDAPYPVSMYASYMNKAVAWYFQHRGIKVVPNIRFGNDKIDAFTFCGLPQNSVIAISYTGIAHERENILNDEEELEKILNELKPIYIIFYGPLPESCRSVCLYHKVTFHVFENDTHRAFRKIRERVQPVLFSDMAEV